MKSSAPNDVVHDYTTRLCWNLAIALEEMTGLPVWVVIAQNGKEVHAFVFDEDTSTAYDIRGELSISEVIRGPWDPNGYVGETIAEWDRDSGTSKRAIAKAKTVAKLYLTEVIGDYT